MATDMADARSKLEHISTNMQERQKQENYMENDIAEVRNQLEQLKDAIEQLNRKIQVKMSNTIDWSTLISVVDEPNQQEQPSQVYQSHSPAYTVQRDDELNERESSTTNSRSRQSTRSTLGVPRTSHARDRLSPSLLRPDARPFEPRNC